MLKLLALLSFLAFGAVDSTQCKYSTDKMIGSRCYSFVSKKHTFKSASLYCNSEGFYLATVDNAINSNFLASMAGTEFSQTKGEFWIGAYRIHDYSLFNWEDGTPFAYSNFQRGYPNAHDYVAENIANGQWLTLPDHTQLEFVCSYDPNMKTTPTQPPEPTTTTPIPTTTTTSTPKPTSTTQIPTTVTPTHQPDRTSASIPPTTRANRATSTLPATTIPTQPPTKSAGPTSTKKAACPTGFTLNPDNNVCYIIVTYGSDSKYPKVADNAPPLTREAQRCAKVHAKLADIHTENENDFLRSLIYDHFQENRYCTIGMYNANPNSNDGQWKWLDNAPVAFKDFGTPFPRRGDTIAQASANGFWVSYTRTAPNEGVVCSVPL